MKIAIDARFYGHENGGLGRYTMNLLRELSKIDHKNEYYLLLRKAYAGKLSLGENFHEVKVDSHHYSLSEQILVPLVLWRVKPDITHFLHFNVPIFFRGEFIVTIHDLLMHRGVGREATTLPEPIYKIKRLAYRLVFDNAVKSAQKILVPTEFVKNEVLDEYGVSPKKVFVTYEGVEEFEYKNIKSSKHENYFLYVGNAYPHKNLEKAIEAIVYLNEVVKRKAKMIIVTPKSVFFERLENVVIQKGSEKYVELLGKVSDTELGSLYRNATAFLYSSLSEGFGLPALEAMSVGTPAIVSDIPVFHEVYGDNAFYFDPKNPQSIAERMNKILTMKQTERKNLSTSLIKFVKKYSWEKMARVTLELYEGKKV